MKTSANRLKIVLTTLLLTSMLQTNAQVNYKIHSLFMYKFTQYIEWPANSGDFVIGVIGNSPIISELESIAATKKVDTRNIVVKKMSASADLSGCQMVFISEGQSSSIGSIAAKLQGKPILLVSESPGAAKKGSGINFVIVDDKMKFELNKAAVEKQGLKVSGDLAKLAIVVG
ncbi:MAG TPA: YfiR family protein [Cytophagaceae bacterium]|jgi:hypothetical protein|nr:YfiR family protein [Cytophagaceae bacterium]